MRDLPGPGIEPMTSALAGGFLTTAPPGKPPTSLKASEDLIYVLTSTMTSSLLADIDLALSQNLLNPFKHALFFLEASPTQQVSCGCFEPKCVRLHLY